MRYVERRIKPNGEKIVVMDDETFRAVVDRLNHIARTGFETESDLANEALNLVKDAL